MGRKIKPDVDPKNDYSDGYNAGRRYWMRKFKQLLKLKKGK